jgi:hypothetical protein
MKICAWCSDEFEPTVSYQIYCGKPCRDAATKQKIQERYLQKRRAKMAEKPRVCANHGCNTTLSIYNTSSVCAYCKTNDKKINKAMKQIMEYFDYEDRRNSPG